MRNGSEFRGTPQYMAPEQRAELDSREVVSALKSGAHPRRLSWRERFARWWFGWFGRLWSKGGKR